MLHCCERVGTAHFSLDLKATFKDKATKEFSTDQFKYFGLCVISEMLERGQPLELGQKYQFSSYSIAYQSPSQYLRSFVNFHAILAVLLTNLYKHVMKESLKMKNWH